MAKWLLTWTARREHPFVLCFLQIFTTLKEKLYEVGEKQSSHLIHEQDSSQALQKSLGEKNNFHLKEIPSESLEKLRVLKMASKKALQENPNSHLLLMIYSSCGKF